jgi:hypothetical protein
MFFKKNIFFVAFLIITTLLTTGCEWPNCVKNMCKSCSNKKNDTVVILENESNNESNNEPTNGEIIIQENEESEEK